MSIGLPTINVVFKTNGTTAIERSARGIVACIVKDDTKGGAEQNVYHNMTDIDFIHYTEENFDFLKLIYEGNPTALIVIRMAGDATDYMPALKKLKDLKWNYLVVPKALPADVTTLSAWIKEQREKNNKTFKAVLPNCSADHEGIINFTTDSIMSSITGKVHATAEYCARIAGVLAGLSLAQSSTYFVLPDITDANVPDDPEERINAGELIVVFDGEKYKIGRGINSLVTFTKEKGEDIRKIKIVEGMDLYKDDIRNTYEEMYVGKVINDYDNKQALVAAINSYHRELEGNVLDKNFDNTVSVDLNAQMKYLEDNGTDISSMKETEIATSNTGSVVFLVSNIKFVDAMEDLKMEVNM